MNYLRERRVYQIIILYSEDAQYVVYNNTSNDRHKQTFYALSQEQLY